LRSFGRRLHGVWRNVLERRLRGRDIRKVNLCCGTQKVPGYFGIDVVEGADLQLDLSKMDLPFRVSSLDTIVCMSAINYFTRARAQQLVREMHRVLRPNGVCRVGVQDLKSLSERYVRGDTEFFNQKLPDGRDRFEGPTIGDKFAAWFYGYAVGSYRCEYFRRAAEAFTSGLIVLRCLCTHRICYPSEYRQLTEKGLPPF